MQLEFMTMVMIGLSILVLLIILRYFPIGLWFQALVTGVRINLLQLFFMRIRKVPPRTIVNAMIEAKKAGIDLDRDAPWRRTIWQVDTFQM